MAETSETKATLPAQSSEENKPSRPSGATVRRDTERFFRRPAHAALDLYPAPPEENRQDRPLIRPYILTGGRTRPRRQPALHALLATTDKGLKRGGDLPSEYLAICELCRVPCSIAEVASWLAVPLGVARVLIDDMEKWGLVTVAAPSPARLPSAEVLGRVLEGLRRL